MSEKPKEEKPKVDDERPVHSPPPEAEPNRSTLAKDEDTSRSDKTFKGTPNSKEEGD